MTPMLATIRFLCAFNSIHFGCALKTEYELHVNTPYMYNTETDIHLFKCFTQCMSASSNASHLYPGVYIYLACILNFCLTTLQQSSFFGGTETSATSLEQQYYVLYTFSMFCLAQKMSSIKNYLKVMNHTLIPQVKCKLSASSLQISTLSLAHYIKAHTC